MTKDTDTLNNTLKKAVNSKHLTDLQNFNIIRRYWKVIIGNSLAEKTAPFKLEKKTLFILVKDASYRHHLDYFVEDILDLIASEAILGEGKVTKIIFRVGEQQKAPEIRNDHKYPLNPLKREEEKKVSEGIKEYQRRRIKGIIRRVDG